MKISEIIRRQPVKSLVIARTKRGMVLQPTEVGQDFAALREESKPEYFDRLENELGIKRLGQGGFARVFQHPTHPDVAVKVFTDSDTAYRSYLKFAQENQGNKYIPKILSVHRHVNNPKMRDKHRNVDQLVDDKYSIVFMEKLTPSTVQKFRDLETYIHNLLGGKSEQSVLFLKLTPSEWKKLGEQSEDKDLAAFAKYMAKVIKSYSAGSDLHIGNIMLRGNQPVFTDPTS